MNLVTFIIPTMGRYSLHKTLASLREQTDPSWEALVIFDGHDITITQDDKIKAIRVDREYKGKSAGLVRNYGLPLVKTEWTAFVDDDDFLDKTYVASLRGNSSKGDIIQFTYKDVTNGNTQPPRNINKLISCNFGISFAVKTELVQKNNNKFQLYGVEDYQFLQDCINAGGKFVITHEIKYYVGGRGRWLV